MNNHPYSISLQVFVNRATVKFLANIYDDVCSESYKKRTQIWTITINSLIAVMWKNLGDFKPVRTKYLSDRSRWALFGLFYKRTIKKISDRYRGEHNGRLHTQRNHLNNIYQCRLLSFISLIWMWHELFSNRTIVHRY